MTSEKELADSQQSNPQHKEAVINAINQLFAEFQLVYNNQYHKAFPTTDKLGYAKKIWFNHLKNYQASQILKAGDLAIQNSEFLPTIKGVVKYIADDSGLPPVRDAFREACLAPSPKNEYNWSHPIVFLAGEKTGWFLLSSEPESKTLPLFEKQYARLAEAFLSGEQLSLPSPENVSQEEHQPLSREEQKVRLESLRKELKL